MRLVIACALLLTACSSPKKEFFVAFSQCNNAEPYRAAQNALMTKLFAEAGGVRLVIADAQQDNSKQVAQVETFIRQKPDLLIVAPNERAALTAVMGQAMEAHMRDLRHDPAMAAALAEHGLRTVLARHSCAHRAHELLDIAAGLGAREAA